MPTFFLAEIESIQDAEMYNEYIEKAAPIVKKYGGEYLFKSNHLTPISGEWNLKRMILIRFPDKGRILQCFQSDEYRQVAHLRENSTISKGIIIESQAAPHSLPSIPDSATRVMRFVRIHPPPLNPCDFQQAGLAPLSEKE